jgi:hypothetical protein
MESQHEMVYEDKLDDSHGYGNLVSVSHLPGRWQLLTRVSSAMVGSIVKTVLLSSVGEANDYTCKDLLNSAYMCRV